MIVLDFIQPKKTHLTENQLMTYGRVTTIIVMAVAGLWAPLIQNFAGLFNYLQQVLSFAVPPVVAVFLFGFFWKRGSNVAAKYTLVLGHILCFICLLLVNMGVIKIHFSIIAGLLTIVCMIGYIAISLTSKVDSIENLENLTWSRGDTLLLRDIPWFFQAKYIGILLIFVTLIIVAIFW
ncbi:MAG: hypothetical protein IPL46_28715 [Saprospiraceae bacterium]|nr:hypothetical protein [Saprospiraceae bacterium]